MYYVCHILIDPSQATNIKKQKPRKAFGRMLNSLTMGIASKKVEEETFTAVSILQQISDALKSRNINNLIRLSVDDVDFYHDHSGINSDLEAASNEFSGSISEEISGSFDLLKMALEHDQPSFKYIIEARVSRLHEVKKYPIEIIINGLFADLVEDSELEKIDRIRKDEAYLANKERKFDMMISAIKEGIEKYLEIDDIKTEVYKRKFSEKSEDDPAFHGYYGFDKYMKYLELW